MVRFKANAIVRHLLDAGPFDMNQLAMMKFPREDREQFAELIGYSLSVRASGQAPSGQLCLAGLPSCAVSETQAKLAGAIRSSGFQIPRAAPGLQATPDLGRAASPRDGWDLALAVAFLAAPPVGLRRGVHDLDIRNRVTGCNPEPHTPGSRPASSIPRNEIPN